MKVIRVWDPFIRIFHWFLVVAVISNYWINEDGGDVHAYLGYAASLFVVARIIWGFYGGGYYVRFSTFFPTPTRLKKYFASVRQGNFPRHISHNPAAAVMMLFLMSLILLLGVTGYMMGTDRFWGEEWLQEVHGWIADILIWSVALHASAAILESFRHRENLIRSMITGKKREDL